MDIKAAFHSSPTWPLHKMYFVVGWQGHFFIYHVLLFGLAKAPGIQGNVANAVVDLLLHWEIAPVFKWVDNFNFLCEPCTSITSLDGLISYSYTYCLSDVIMKTGILGIPWHPVTKKGHDFGFASVYVGFDWDLITHTVSLLEKSHVKYLFHLITFTSSPKSLQMRPQSTMAPSNMSHLYSHEVAHSFLAFPIQFVCSKAISTGSTMYQGMSRWILSGGKPPCQCHTFCDLCFPI